MQSFQIILLPIILGNLSFCQEDCSLMSWPVALVNFLDCYRLRLSRSADFGFSEAWAADPSGAGAGSHSSGSGGRVKFLT